MTILPIKRFGDPVLREPANPVEQFDDALAKLAEDMLETMYDAPGVGLAGPQVGVSLRLIVFDDGTGPRRLANPELHDPQGEQVGEEGCLSLPGLYFPVTRAMSVQVTGIELDGTPVVFRAEEFLARILQHETDHVNGILFIDRLSADDRREAMRALRDQELGIGGGRPDPSRAL
jgi:peptide deformylase